LPPTGHAIKEITEIFPLIRGTLIIVQPGFQWLDHEAFGPVLPQPSNPSARLPLDIEAALASLSTCNRSAHSSPESLSHFETFEQPLSML
jgi:hypothetical protein